MSEKEKAFLKRLLVTFQGEAEERLAALAFGLVELEKVAEESPTQEGTVPAGAAAGSKQRDLVEMLFRELHSLKGAARSVNLVEIEAICQAMEDLFSALKRQQIAPSPALLDTLHQAATLLTTSVAHLNSDAANQEKGNHGALIRRMKELLKPGARANAVAPATPPVAPVEATPAAAPPVVPPWSRSPASAASSVTPASNAGESIRIAAARLEDLLLQTEELVAVKLAVGQRMADLRDSHTRLAQWRKRWAALRPSLRAISHTLKAIDRQPAENQSSLPVEWQRLRAQSGQLLEFLEWNHQWIEEMDDHLASVSSATQRDQRAIGGMVDHLLEDMKQVMMLPFSSILEVFPSVTRELARKQNKEVQVSIRGGEIEVDRRILQEIKDPLMHLVRNSIDHGIEAPEVRAERQKPRRGQITIMVTQQDSNKFEIVVADDGGGLDLSKVRESAARLGFVSEEKAERMGDQEIKSLVFHSGLSTSPEVTDLSGHGLGLAIVQEKVEKLGGTITLEAEPEQGTTFRLQLPLTLATLRGLLVCSEGHTLILPIIHVERVARMSGDETKAGADGESVELNGESFPLVSLAKPLELHGKSARIEAPDRLLVVLLNAGEKRMAFWVDEIIGEQEVLMKGLGPQLTRVRNIAGATVLGNGQVVPIINVADLVKSAMHRVVA